MREVRFSAEARADVDSIFDYIVADSADAAESVVDVLERACLELATWPERYPVKVQRAQEMLRRRPVGRYNVYYTVKTNLVEIVRVLHSARDLDEALND